MRLHRAHPLGRDVVVWLDGERLHFCLMADDRAGVAEVALLDADGRPQREDGRIKTEIRRGAVRFTAQPGHEEQLTWFSIGWICGWEEAGGSDG